MPSNSTLIANWWALLHLKGAGAERRFAEELRRYPQVQLWDLNQKRAAINDALPLATSAAEMVELVEDRSKRRGKALAETSEHRNWEEGLAKKKAASQGRCIHNVSGYTCPLCAGEYRVVFISGGGTHWHLRRNCSALEDGQEQVRLRGGQVEAIASYGRNEPSVRGKDPCITCVRRRR